MFRQSFMDIAISMAKSNPIQGLPRIAAVIIDFDNSIMYGINKRKTHPLQKKFGKNTDSIYLHAEIDAIKNYVSHRILEASNLRNAIMYIARVKRDGSLGFAKPCEGCQRALIHFGISEVYWTKDEW